MVPDWSHGRNAAGEGKIEVGNPLEPCQGSQENDLPGMVENPKKKQILKDMGFVAHLPVINVVIACYSHL